MRHLGIDYGSKRVGVAISDEAGSFAFPLAVLANTSDLVLEVAKICKDNNIGLIVVGESKDFSQDDNQIMKEIVPFVKKIIEETGLDVHMHPEFLTSAEAEQIQGKTKMHDASAAALILKSYLDTKNN
jgi:putative Holliday junction resolvase